MHEDIHSQSRSLRPERFELWGIDGKAIDLRRDDYALKPEIHRAARKFAESLGTSEGMDVRRADESAWIIPLRFLCLVIHKARFFEVHAHAGGAGQNGGVYAREVHRANVLIQVKEEGVSKETGNSILIQMKNGALP